MPEILGTLFPPLKKYVPILPDVSAPQAFFLLLKEREAFYGGSAGGGKSASWLAVLGWGFLIAARAYTSWVRRHEAKAPPPAQVTPAPAPAGNQRVPGWGSGDY